MEKPVVMTVLFDRCEYRVAVAFAPDEYRIIHVAPKPEGQRAHAEVTEAAVDLYREIRKRAHLPW